MFRNQGAFSATLRNEYFNWSKSWNRCDLVSAFSVSFDAMLASSDFFSKAQIFIVRVNSLKYYYRSINPKRIENEPITWRRFQIHWPKYKRDQYLHLRANNHPILDEAGPVLSFSLLIIMNFSIILLKYSPVQMKHQ